MFAKCGRKNFAKVPKISIPDVNILCISSPCLKEEATNTMELTPMVILLFTAKVKAFCRCK